MQTSDPVESLIAEAKVLARSAGRLRFKPPVTHVYNPLTYAWSAHEAYLRKFGSSPKRVLFLGMNPGPFGMVQTGVPFGEIAAVRDWMRIEGGIVPPAKQHRSRPITGFACPRSEVSGKRLWGLFAQRFGDAQNFFRDHFVVNYCPLAFLEASGANRTPNKLPSEEAAALQEICDQHLRAVLEILQPEWAIGIGGFAATRLHKAIDNKTMKIGMILHPSPACPAANKDWAGQATAQLTQLGVW